jgi:hypothetical protein
MIISAEAAERLTDCLERRAITLWLHYVPPALWDKVKATLEIMDAAFLAICRNDPNRPGELEYVVMARGRFPIDGVFAWEHPAPLVSAIIQGHLTGPGLRQTWIGESFALLAAKGLSALPEYQ